MKRTYENALRLLESRRRQVRPKASLGSGGVGAASELPVQISPSTLRGIPSLYGMSEWLKALGHSSNAVNELNIIHVAGTKGKGSTCAFTRSLLQAHGLRTGFPRKIGLYTSPHLRNIRERIQINGKPIVKDLFTKYFFEVWDGLEARSPLVIDGKERTPRYLQLLALVAVHTFIRERMDATIIETHHGGEYDTTNFVQRPIVTGITSLGLDHVAQLGSDIESIAWHKAGIFKPGAAAFSVSQDPAAIPVLKARAAEKGTQLTFVETDPSLPTSSILEVPTQKINISLALSLANAFLERKAHPENGQLSSSDVLAGIEGFSWPGRYEIIVDGSNQWFLDGAHNELSLRQVGDWFAKATSKKKLGSSRQILIFTHISEERNGEDLLKCLAKSLTENSVRPSHVIFTTYQERMDGSTEIDNTKNLPQVAHSEILALYSKIWQAIDPEAVIAREQTIEGALSMAREIGEQSGGMQTLITGSLYLVGGALNLLKPLE